MYIPCCASVPMARLEIKAETSPVLLCSPRECRIPSWQTETVGRDTTYCEYNSDNMVSHPFFGRVRTCECQVTTEYHKAKYRNCESQLFFSRTGYYWIRYRTDANYKTSTIHFFPNKFLGRCTLVIQYKTFIILHSQCTVTTNPQILISTPQSRNITLPRPKRVPRNNATSPTK